MTNNPEVLIIIDSLKYVKKEEDIKESISNNCKPFFYYTDYENRLIRFLHGTPFVGNLFSHLVYWSISFMTACKLYFYRNNIRNKIFINPIVAIFYSFLQALTSRQENVVVAGFLFEKKKNVIYYKMRKMFVSFSYRRVSKIVVYSKNEVNFYSVLFPSLAPKFTFVLYGRDYDIFEETEFESDKPYIASGGMSNRDFQTLIKALQILQAKKYDVQCKIATRPEGCDLQPTLPNLEILYNIRIEKFGSFLRNSKFVIIPLANTALSAGHMALLEAMCKKKIVLITDIPSVRDYVSDELVYFYEPNNSDDLAQKIEYLNSNINEEKAKKASEYYSSNYNFSALLVRIVKVALQ